MGVPKKTQKSEDSKLTSPELKTLNNHQRNYLIELLCLELLATEGVEWSYDIYLKLEESLSTEFFMTQKIKPFDIYPQLIDRLLVRLRKQSFIQRAEEPRKSKNGPAQKPWSITLLGLLYVLKFREDLWSQIDNIATIHADKLPLIFKEENWKRFTENCGKKRVIEAIKSFCETYFSDFQMLVADLSKIDERLEADLTRHILWFPMSLLSVSLPSEASKWERQRMFECLNEENVQWIKIWMDGEDLERFFVNTLCKDYHGIVSKLYAINLVRDVTNSSILTHYIDKVTLETNIQLILRFVNSPVNNSKGDLI